MHDAGKAQKNQNAAASQKEILSEIQEDLNIREQRQRMFPRAALVGLCVGLVASFFSGLRLPEQTLFVTD